MGQDGFRVAHRRQPEPGSGIASGDLRHALALGQGIFYLLTGLWPLVSSGSFQRVTGPKTDLWLVKTVGALVAVIGGVLLLAARRRRVTPEIELLAAGGAAGLAAIDIVYVARRAIAPIYLLDAAVEVALIVSWLVAGRPGRR